MDTIERLDLEENVIADTLDRRDEPPAPNNEPSNLPDNNDTNILSKYQRKQQKRLAREEKIKNFQQIKNYKGVNEGDIEKHNKVSKRLYVAKDSQSVSVVCDKTGIVSLVTAPSIKGFAFEYASPFSILSNARGIVQEGKDYLHSLDTQLVAGIFITLATEYSLLRYKPTATGAENNAILRTAGKDKLVEGCLLIEGRIHSANVHYLPGLSLIYEHDLKDTGCEGRLTEWMKLVNDALSDPDLTEYDENALLNKPMKGIKELKKEHTALRKEEKRVNSLKDKNYKSRAAFRKDMREAKGLVKSLKGIATDKLVGFLGSLFSEDSYLTVDTLLLGQVITKLEPLNTLSSTRLIEILKTDRSDLRAESVISDLDDPLMPAPKADVIFNTPVSDEETDENNDEENAAWEEAEKSAEEYFIASINAVSGEVESKKEDISIVTKGTMVMPEGLSKIEQILWKKRNGHV